MYIPNNHLSCFQNQEALWLVPNLHIHTFQPPQDAMGAAKKWYTWPLRPGSWHGCLGPWNTSSMSVPSCSEWPLTLPLPSLTHPQLIHTSLFTNSTICLLTQHLKPSAITSLSKALISTPNLSNLTFPASVAAWNLLPQHLFQPHHCTCQTHIEGCTSMPQSTNCAKVTPHHHPLMHHRQSTVWIAQSRWHAFPPHDQHRIHQPTAAWWDDCEWHPAPAGFLQGCFPQLSLLGWQRVRVPIPHPQLWLHSNGTVLTHSWFLHCLSSFCPPPPISQASQCMQVEPLRLQKLALLASSFEGQDIGPQTCLKDTFKKMLFYFIHSYSGDHYTIHADPGLLDFLFSLSFY